MTFKNLIWKNVFSDFNYSFKNIPKGCPSKEELKIKANSSLIRFSSNICNSNRMQMKYIKKERFNFTSEVVNLKGCNYNSFKLLPEVRVSGKTKEVLAICKNRGLTLRQNQRKYKNRVKKNKIPARKTTFKSFPKSLKNYLNLEIIVHFLQVPTFTYCKKFSNNCKNYFKICRNFFWISRKLVVKCFANLFLISWKLKSRVTLYPLNILRIILFPFGAAGENLNSSLKKTFLQFPSHHCTWLRAKDKRSRWYSLPQILHSMSNIDFISQFW